MKKSKRELKRREKASAQEVAIQYNEFMEGFLDVGEASQPPNRAKKVRNVREGERSNSMQLLPFVKKPNHSMRDAIYIEVETPNDDEHDWFNGLFKFQVQEKEVGGKGGDEFDYRSLRVDSTHVNESRLTGTQSSDMELQHAVNTHKSLGGINSHLLLIRRIELNKYYLNG